MDPRNYRTTPQNQQPNQRTKKKNGGGNWIGILIFLLVIGSQFIPQLLNNLSGILGPATTQQLGAVLPSLVPFLIIGLIILSIVVPVIMAIGRGLGRLSESGSDMSYTATNTPTTTYTASSSASSGMPKLPTSPFGAPNLPTSQGPFPRGVHLGQSRFENANSSLSQLPRGVNMEIPRGIDMERLSARGTPQRYTTPGFEPIVDGKVLAYGFVGLVLLGGALLVLGLI
jgi:uncharacterized membrane protein YphA (DoxX/SURF4 family)